LEYDWKESQGLWKFLGGFTVTDPRNCEIPFDTKDRIERSLKKRILYPDESPSNITIKADENVELTLLSGHNRILSRYSFLHQFRIIPAEMRDRTDTTGWFACRADSPAV
jgi:hypothetical protein